MGFSERDYKDATQLAYMDCFSSAYKKLLESGKESPFTVKELLEASVNVHDAELRAIEEGFPPNAISFKELLRFSTLSQGDIDRLKVLSDKCMDWKVNRIHDTNDENGFYACAIEAEDKKGIVAFRGSESTDNNIKNDWVDADIALLASDRTVQQEEAEKFADELVKCGWAKDKSEVCVTGHSLGGSLATHFGIACAKKGREELAEKIEEIANMDGPGMSQKYIETYANEIEKMGSKIIHYKWSAIGNLLHNIPGEKEVFIASNKKMHADKTGIWKSLWRHDTNTLMFDDNGKMKRGRQDALSIKLGALSRAIDTSVFADVVREILQKGVLTADMISKFVKGTHETGVMEKKNGLLDVLGNTLVDKEPVYNQFKGIKEAFKGELTLLTPDMSPEIGIA